MTTETTPVEVPDWLTPGSKVGVISTSYNRVTRVSVTTVERVLKRDIVLANGERFRRRDIDQARTRAIRFDSTWSSRMFEMWPADAPTIANALREIVVGKAINHARTQVDQYKRGNQSAREVAAAWSALADLEES